MAAQKAAPDGSSSFRRPLRRLFHCFVCLRRSSYLWCDLGLILWRFGRALRYLYGLPLCRDGQLRFIGFFRFAHFSFNLGLRDGIRKRFHSGCAALLAARQASDDLDRLKTDRDHLSNKSYDVLRVFGTVRVINDAASLIGTDLVLIDYPLQGRAVTKTIFEDLRWYAD